MLGRRKRGALCAIAAAGGLVGAVPADAASPVDRVRIVQSGGLGVPQATWDPRSSERYVPTIPAALSDAVRQTFGDRFAALYYLRAKGRKPVLVLRLTRPTATDRALVNAALALPQLDFVTAKVAIVPARFSAQQLLDARDRLARTLGRSAASVGIDEMANQVVVSLVDPTRKHVAPHPITPGKARSVLRQAGVDKAAVRWMATERHRVAQAAYPSGTYGGTRVGIARTFTTTYLCTTGFAFTSSAGRFMTTAGHCADIGNNVYAVASPGATALGSVVGFIASTRFDRVGDLAAYATFAYGRLWVNGQTWYVQGQENPAAGEYVCFNGAVSGFRCGVVTRTNTAITTNIGTVGNQFCIAANADSGDSGAAMYTVVAGANGVTYGRVRGILSNQTTNQVCGTMVGPALLSWAGTLVTDAPACC